MHWKYRLEDDFRKGTDPEECVVCIDIRRNQVSKSLVFESYRFVLTKNSLYVGKWYECKGMFKMNVMDAKTKGNKNNNVALT